MEKRILLLVLALFSCYVQAQKKPKIKGNKNVVEVREYLPAFKAIELNDDLDIILQKSSEESYNIVADDNLLDIFKFKVEDSTLVITSFYKVTGKKKLEITVNYQELEAITLRNGRIDAESMISSNKFYLNTFGSSKMKLNVSAGLMHVNMEENSSGDLNIDSDSLYVSLKDKIDVSMYSVSETANFEMYKNATVKIDGTTDSLHLKLVENSNFKGSKLEAASALLDLEGSPSARVYVFKDIELISRGTSKTILSGNPKITITEFMNKSLLRKEED